MKKPELKYEKTYKYLKAIADDTPEGYFYINIEKAWRDLDLSKRTMFYHIDKLQGRVFRVYSGTFVPDKLAQDILRDAGNNIRSISSLYYIPRGEFDDQLRRDIAILRYCFGWHDVAIKHFLRWSQANKRAYDENLTGLSKMSETMLKQFFKYIVHEQFELDNEEYLDKFEALRK